MLDLPDPIQLRTYPDPVLKRTATPIEEISEEVRAAVARMFEIMYEERGIGLAAPQVGWSRRLFVVNLGADPAETEEELVFINPVVSDPQGTATDEEGCLSFPDIRAPVTRPERVRVTATDLDGNRFEREIDGLLARCVQHELDHLDGLLLTDRTTLGARMRMARALKGLRRAYREAQESGR